jgi:plasmid stabilization system protein ParE
MKLSVALTAQAYLARLPTFLADKNPSAASRAASKIVAAIQSLGTFPRRGRLFGASNFRDLVVPFGRSFYVIRYAHRVEADEVMCFGSGMVARRVIRRP